MKIINKYLPYFVLVSVVILDLIIFYAVMNVLNVLEKELIVGLIAFLGSILGGLITLVGVNATLKHRDREVFLISATEKLLAVEELITKLKGFSNNITMYDATTMDLEPKCAFILKEAFLFNEELDVNKALIYKNLDYDKVHMIDYYQKTLSPIIRKLQINEEEKDACFEKVHAIFGILLESQKDMQNKYYKYKREHNKF